MIDDFAKEYLHHNLRETREVMLWKLDGLSEYDIRRPLTSTGTNLLGLVKHQTLSESRYFGEVFDRPFPESLARWDDLGARGDDMWATEYETREEIIDHYRRVWEHSDATITALAIDSPGYVPWWPRPNVKLFNVMVHILTATSRHAGHADILREQLDGSTGTTAEYANPQRDAAFWDAQCAKVERAAKAAATKPDHATGRPRRPAPIEPCRETAKSGHFGHRVSGLTGVEHPGALPQTPALLGDRQIVAGSGSPRSRAETAAREPPVAPRPSRPRSPTARLDPTGEPRAGASLPDRGDP